MKKHLLLLAGLMILGGCATGAGSRAWQSADMPSHDRQRVFDAARLVLGKHFEVADASFGEGTIATKPKPCEGRRGFTLADVRGAGGKCRQTAFLELDRDGLTMIVRAAVLLERERTEQARAILGAQSDAREDELPRTGPRYEKSRGGTGKDIWVEVGYDASLARELLAAIADQVRRMEQGEAVPMGQPPAAAAEETRRLGGQTP